MYVINEAGSGAINLDRCASIGFGTNDQTGEAVLLVQDGSMNYPLASGGDRPQRAMEAVMKALQSGKRVIDLHDLLGTKPNITIPSSIIIPPNGGKG